MKHIGDRLDLSLAWPIVAIVVPSWQPLAVKARREVVATCCRTGKSNVQLSMCKDGCPKIETDVLDRSALCLINAKSKCEANRKLEIFELEVGIC